MVLLARFESTGAAIAVSFTYLVTQVPLYFVANRVLDEAEHLPPEDRASPGLAPAKFTSRLPTNGRIAASRLHCIARAV